MLFLVSGDSHHLLEGFYLAGAVGRWPQAVPAEMIPGAQAPSLRGAPNKTLGNPAALPLEALGRVLPLISFLRAYAQDTRVR